MSEYKRGRHPLGHVATPAEAQARFRDNTVEDENGCWIWQRQIIPWDGKRGGYGLAHTPKGWGLVNKTTAHRVSWLIFRGEIPKGVEICHRCDIRRCVNPSHLFLGDSATNTIDMIDKERHPDCMQTRLVVGDVADMISASRAGEPKASIARRYGYSPSYVSTLIARGRDPLTALQPVPIAA